MNSHQTTAAVPGSSGASRKGLTSLLRIVAMIVGMFVLLCVATVTILRFWRPDLSGTWVKCPPLAHSTLSVSPSDPFDVHSLNLLAEYSLGYDTSLDRHQVSLSPDFQYLASLSPGSIVIQRLVSGKTVQKITVSEETVVAPAWSSDSKYFAYGLSGYRQPKELGQLVTPRWPNHVVVWDIEAGKQILELEGLPGNIDAFTFIGPIYFSPDNKLVIAQSGDGYYVWDRMTGEMLCDFSVNDPFWDSRTEDMMLSLGWRVGEPPLIAGQVVGRGIPTNSTRIWNVKGGKTIQIIDTEKDLFWYGIWSPASRYVALGSSGVAYGVSPNRITIWSVSEGDMTLELDENYSFLDWAPDEEKILVGSDTAVEIWDVKSREMLAAIEKPESTIGYGGYWSEDGNTIAILLENGIVQLWKVQ